MSWLWMLPLAAQGGLMGFDELRLHRRRGLSRWERIGHPIDTLSVLLCLLLPWVLPLGARSLWLYAALAALSCLLITKDEGVHTERCGALEHWVHAVLFVLHPIVLAVPVLLWAAREQHPLARAIGDATRVPLPEPALASFLLLLHAVLVAAFAVFQASYWAVRPR